MLNHSYENEFNLHVNENLLAHERMSTRTCFENEANFNSERPIVPTPRSENFKENRVFLSR